MAPRKTAETAESDETPAVDETPTPRVFQLRAGATVAGEPVHRVCFGCAPRVSLGPGDRFETTDETLAAALAADELLEEVTK